LSLLLQRQCEPDINDSGHWREELAKAAGFTAGDFAQNPDFYGGANLWVTGKFRNFDRYDEIEFQKIGLCDGTECISITIRYLEQGTREDYVSPMDDPKVSLHLSIWKRPGEEAYIGAFAVPGDTGLTLETTALEACRKIRPYIEKSRPVQPVAKPVQQP